ncbi:MAG: tyrosine protein kinase [Proteobacteria bacterium]|nr:MAG: tyrosine protein kinase [Pseudomonadota bacterium]
MNLRKAMDKAKKERSDRMASSGQTASESDRLQGAGNGSTWQKPVYTDSKPVNIDMATAIKNHCVALSPEFAEVDYYKVLRTQLRQIGKDRAWNTIMVTSVSPREGKTVTAINLAVTFAREYSQTVMLVDADLRGQSIHRYLGYESQLGLLDVLEERAAMKDVIVWPGIEKFTVISGGGKVADSSEIMGSPRMSTLVHELKSRYDDRYVIFDVPPVMGGADALAFAPLVDCIILVVGPGVTRQQEMKKALEMLPPDKIAGFVLNQNQGAIRLHGNK